MNRVEELVRRTIGLDAATVGGTVVRRAAQMRMAQTGDALVEQYLERLTQSPAELEALIEDVVIPETWFFRDGAPFSALTRWVTGCWLPTHRSSTLRVLTAPCSTGEEPYSAAMALLEAGLDPERFTVDAIDVSHRALARARRAIYGSNSFRGKDLTFRERFFTEQGDTWRLADRVKAQVRFAIGNLIAADFQPGHGSYDVIFCRNLLIYFDRETQARAVAALRRILAPGGLLLVGHAETGLLAGKGLVPTEFSMSFSFRVGEPERPLIAPRVVSRPPLLSRQSTIRFFAPPPPLVLKQPVTASLESARSLADAGKLTEAALLCEEYLRCHASSAEGWYLFGLVRDSAGEKRKAAECYSKALYLEPEHEEALLQRALLAEEAGEASLAVQLRRRLERTHGRLARP